MGAATAQRQLDLPWPIAGTLKLVSVELELSNRVPKVDHHLEDKLVTILLQLLCPSLFC